jgi:spore maturation protein CgeB
MRIVGLWVSKYFSGSTDERFLKPLLKLGHDVRIVPLEGGGADARLLKCVKEWQPQAIIHVPYPGTIRNEIIKGLKTAKVKTICWNGDDEWAWQTATEAFHPKALAEAHDWVVTTDADATNKYQKAGHIKKLILESWGFSASDWRRRETEKDLDIYFCGQSTTERNIYLRELRDAGFEVLIEGAGYSKPVSLDEMAYNYRRARIGLNFTSGKKGDFAYKQVKARNFEVPACGTFMLTEGCGQLLRYFAPGTEIATFDSVRELLAQCRYYLENWEAREQIAARGHAAVQEYSYEKIFRRVLEKVLAKERK